MENQGGQHRTNYKKVTIRTTDGSNLSGSVNVADGTRVSDMLQRTDQQYIVLTDFVHRAGSGKVLFVNKSQIVWVVPEE